MNSNTDTLRHLYGEANAERAFTGNHASEKDAELSPCDEKMLKKLDAWWRASNYLSAGQLYLLDNPLLREPLKREHIKRKIVGHWARYLDRISFSRISTVSSRPMISI